MASECQGHLIGGTLGEVVDVREPYVDLPPGHRKGKKYICGTLIYSDGSIMGVMAPLKGSPYYDLLVDQPWNHDAVGRQK